MFKMVFFWMTVMIDDNAKKKNSSSVMSTDSAHWSVEPSMKYSLPRLEDRLLIPHFSVSMIRRPMKFDIIENKSENPRVWMHTSD